MLENGFELIDNFIGQDYISLMNQEFNELAFPINGGGLRNAEKKLNTVKETVESSWVLEVAERYLSGKASLVRCILFNKTPENNWLVTWHQDRTVAVSTKFECDGWGPWSIKDNIHHVQPPIEVLNYMVKRFSVQAKWKPGQ